MYEKKFPDNFWKERMLIKRALCHRRKIQFKLQKKLHSMCKKKEESCWKKAGVYQ